MSDLLGLSLSDLLGFLREHWDADAFNDAAAAAYVKQARASGVRPQLSYRCESKRHCGLFTAWNTPAGVILAHPKIRLSPVRFEAVTWPSGSGRLRDVRISPNGATVWPPRAYIMTSCPVVIACEHRWQLISPQKIRDDVAQALRQAKDIHTVKRVAPTDSASVG